MKQASSIATGRIEQVPEDSPWREGNGLFIIRWGRFMARALPLKIGWCMFAIAFIRYFCAFPDLAVLLGNFVASLLLMTPTFIVQYYAHRFLLGHRHFPAELTPFFR
jgi:hypothetical protein